MIRTARNLTISIATAATVALAAVGLTATPATAASADPVLQVSHEVAPTHLAPGETGSMAVLVRNVGGTPTSGEVTVTSELPAGMIGLAALAMDGVSWNCADPAGGSSIECTSNTAMPLPPKGAPSLIYVMVMAEPSASGRGQSVVTAVGGGDATPTSSSAPYALTAEPGDFDLARFGGWAVDSAGLAARQAGAHPDLSTDIQLATDDLEGRPTTKGNLKNITVDLPAGLVANPRALPTCSTAEITGPDYALCAPESQVGTVMLTTTAGPLFPNKFIPPIGIYNVEPPKGVPARFAFNANGVVTYIDPVISAKRGYAVTAKVTNASQSLAVIGSEVTIWGVPQDSVYDSVRSRGLTPGFPTSALRLPFVTAPTSCTGAPLETRLSIVSWQEPALIRTGSFDSDFDGKPILNEGCDRLAFTPSVETDLSSAAADSSTGLDVSIGNPQNLDAPDGLASAHFRDVEVELPDGLTVNPSSATGLEACSDEQLGLGDDEPIVCPLGSKIGSAVVETPVLAKPLEGGVYLRSQASDDPESGEMFRLALVIDSAERGIRVKLPGTVKVDAQTGRITVSFRDNPQLPVESVEVSLKPGSRAPLATPASCGEKQIDIGVASWAGHDRDLESKFGIDCPGLGGFAPSFAAGSVNPVGGEASPFVVRIDRADREQFVDGVDVDLPEGVLAKLAGVPLCGDADANAGTCGAGSRVGSATVGAGPGASPFYLRDQPVYLAGGYKGAPYSLSVAARAVAGPFDLGMVVVRQALHVDPETARVKVVSDPVPTIVKGVPLRLRSIDVSVDRPDFTRNPTSCAVKQVTARLHSQQGSSHTGQARFQVGDCQSLALQPRLAMRLSGRKQTKTPKSKAKAPATAKSVGLTDGAHPDLDAHLTMAPGGANLKRAEVTLPLALALDPDNANGLCEPKDADADKCPAKSIVGNVKAVSPILPDPLTGPVHLVRGERIDSKTGRVLRTLPKLYVPLTGTNGIRINLRATSDVNDRGQLVTTFDNIPDAPVSDFQLHINGGARGILVVTLKKNVCAESESGRRGFQAFIGQNGKRIDQEIELGNNCPFAISASSHTSTALRLTVSGVPAGKLSASAAGVGSASKTVTNASGIAALSLPLKKATRTALARGKNVKVKVKVRYTPKGAKKAKTVTRTLVIHGTKQKKKR